jgi:hypothetical protein
MWDILVEDFHCVVRVYDNVVVVLVVVVLGGGAGAGTATGVAEGRIEDPYLA